MNLTFTQDAKGVNKEINLNVVDTCQKCQGSRSEPGTRAVKCPYCNGTGMETVSTGPFVMRTTCRRCMGSRMFIQKPCLECEGKGSTVQRKRVTVPVPAGETFICLFISKSTALILLDWIGPIWILLDSLPFVFRILSLLLSSILVFGTEVVSWHGQHVLL